MKPQELMMLALRVLAVFIASQAFIYLAEAATFWAMPPDNRSGMPLTALSSVWLFGPFITSILVWWCAPVLSRLATGRIADVSIASVSTDAVVGSTFVAAGALIFIIALPGLISNSIRMFGDPGLFIYSSLAASISKCILGAALIGGSQAIPRFLFWLRYAGVNR